MVGPNPITIKFGTLAHPVAYFEWFELYKWAPLDRNCHKGPQNRWLWGLSLINNETFQSSNLVAGMHPGGPHMATLILASSNVVKVVWIPEPQPNIPPHFESKLEVDT